jgi:hypothetical protein
MRDIYHEIADEGWQFDVDNTPVPIIVTMTGAQAAPGLDLFAIGAIGLLIYLMTR